MQDLKKKIISKKAKIGVIGLGYVGLPLVKEFLNAGFNVTGFDIDKNKIKSLSQGKSYIKHIPNSVIKDFKKTGRWAPSSDFTGLSKLDAIIICVPTPLNKHREPDLSHVISTAKVISKYMQKGQLIVLESTTYPGTTEEDVLPILAKNGFKAGKDFFLAFSPEREDPGNKKFGLKNMPKIVGGVTPACLKIADLLYSQIVSQTVLVSSPRVAEAAKLLENIYRAVNIALVNELKMLFDRMDIDVFEVINAAKTKPFGFQAFYPGPGLGGHCIPIDPFYLTWKARQYDFSTKFIELAGEINTNMPYYVVSKIIESINQNNKPIKGAKILIIGLAYKKDVDDQRESPAFKVISLLRQKGAAVSYHDPYIPVYSGNEHAPALKMRSVKLTKARLKNTDCVVILADHSNVDYGLIVKHAPLIVDTRNVAKKIKNSSAKIIQA